MSRKLSKRPKVVRKLDGALTAWRYFHGPNFVHEARDRLRVRTHSDPVRALLRAATARSIRIEENQALFAVLVAFVEWMQAPISPRFSYETWDTQGGFWHASASIDGVEFASTIASPQAYGEPFALAELCLVVQRTRPDVYADFMEFVLRAPRTEKGRSNIARALSKGRPNSPFCR